MQRQPRTTFEIAALTAALLLASAFPALAQAGRVTGRALDQTGAVLPGVTIDLVSQQTEFTATTDKEGRFQFDNVPAGAAELTFRLLNFSVVRPTLSTGAAGATMTDTVLVLALNADVVVTGTTTFRNIADVENPAESLVGIATAASQGAVTAAQLDARPVARAGEVLETIPGMIISQHSGEGKANQYNIFDAKVSDIDYFYTSRLRGEPAGGVDDVNLHPAPPRSARIGIQISF
jgi:hypothetical protein